MGDAVGVGDAADGQISDDDRLVSLPAVAGDGSAAFVNADAGELGQVQVLHFGLVFGCFTCRGVDPVGLILGLHGIRQGAHHRFCIVAFALFDDVGGIADFIFVIGHRDFVAVIVLLDFGSGNLLPAGLADGDQLVADNGLAVFHTGDQEAVDRVSVAVAEVAVGLELEVAHPGEGQGLEAVGVRAVNGLGHLFVAHQEEAVAGQGAVHGAAGVIAGGGHIQIDAAHSGAVADLGGVDAAYHFGAVASAGVHAVHAVPEDGSLLFVSFGVDVGNVVADYGELLHVGPKTRNGCVH